MHLFSAQSHGPAVRSSRPGQLIRVVVGVIRRPVRTGKPRAPARRIACGNPAQFQGDERGTALLSLVEVPTGNPLPIRHTDSFRQRFNAAANRARNQIWVVYSLNCEVDLQPGEGRRLIEHALGPTAMDDHIASAEGQAESEFERQVIRRLVAAGFRVTPRWRVGRYGIDIVVEGDWKRLAVECDGDRVHPIEKLPEEMERQAILERLGWTFVRLRGSEFFHEPDRAMAAVFRKLEELGISPEAAAPDALSRDCGVDELLHSVIRRAAEIRDKWHSDG